jgi:hypothetical protein
MQNFHAQPRATVFLHTLFSHGNILDKPVKLLDFIMQVEKRDKINRLLLKSLS